MIFIAMPSNYQAFLPPIAFTTGGRKEQVVEEYIAEHMLCHVLQGETHLLEATSERILHAGETFLLQRNHLVKCGRHPLPGKTSYQVISCILSKEFLQAYALKHMLTRTATTVVHPPVLALSIRPPLKGLFQSLLPYMEAGQTLSDAMMQHKREEAVLALLEQDATLEQWLFDFTEPGKTDLQAFMQRNYMFNVPMTKFAELTGRSLSTFQRDFQKLFGVTATTWLLKRRLQAAHEALAIHHRKPVDIYLEVGFEDISHFSRAFKNEFGYTPSAVKQQQA